MHKPLITHPVLHRIVLLLGLSLLLQSCLLFSSDPSAVTINETEQQTPFELDGTVVFRSFDRWFYIKGGDSEVSIINFQNLDIDFFGEYRVSPDGTKVAFLAEGDDEILIFELPSGQVVERKTFNEDLVQISWHPNSQTLVALDRFENLRYALETPDETKFRKPFFLTDYNIRQRFSVLGFAFGREDPASKEVEVYYAYNYLDGQIWKTSIAKIGLSDEDILLVENNGNFYGDVRLRLGENSGEVVWLPTFANTGFFESLFYANIRNSQNFDLRFIPANLGKIKYNLSNDGKFLVYLGFNPALNKQVLIKRNILNEEEEIITFPTNNQIEVRDFDWSN